MRNQYGYGSYRGRGGFRIFLKIVIAILAVALVVLVGGYFFLQQFAVVTDSGVYYDIPFLRGKEPTPDEPLVIETPPVIIAPTPTPTPEPEPEPVYFRMTSYEQSVLLEGAAAKSAISQQENPSIQPLFTMKSADGLLGYVSGLQSAKDLGTSASNLTLNEGIQSITDSQGDVMYPGAYIACFRDNTVPYRRNGYALRTGGGNWRDAQNTRWMSPQSAEARQYVTDVCAELASLGFRNLVLDYAAFPLDDGRLGQITTNERYDTGTLEETVTAFYRQLRERIDLGGSWPTEGTLKPRLNIVTDKITLDEGRNSATGQSLDALIQYADRIYVDLAGADPADYYEDLKAAGMERPEENLVVILTAPPAGEVDYSWAILPEK